MAVRALVILCSAILRGPAAGAGFAPHSRTARAAADDYLSTAAADSWWTGMVVRAAEWALGFPLDPSQDAGGFVQENRINSVLWRASSPFAVHDMAHFPWAAQQ